MRHHFLSVQASIRHGKTLPIRNGWLPILIFFSFILALSSFCFDRWSSRILASSWHVRLNVCRISELSRKLDSDPPAKSTSSRVLKMAGNSPWNVLRGRKNFRAPQVSAISHSYCYISLKTFFSWKGDRLCEYEEELDKLMKLKHAHVIPVIGVECTEIYFDVIMPLAQGLSNPKLEFSLDLTPSFFIFLCPSLFFSFPVSVYDFVSCSRARFFSNREESYQ